MYLPVVASPTTTTAGGAPKTATEGSSWAAATPATERAVGAEEASA